MVHSHAGTVMASCLTGCDQEQANETAARVRFVLTRISGTRDAASLGMAFNLLFFCLWPQRQQRATYLRRELI